MRLLFVLALLAARAAFAEASFDPLVTATMKEWNVPGMAVAVVKDGKVIHSGAYGFRDVRQQLPVTAKTLFGIGSITKSVTVLTLGVLAAEGKLDWDRPVRDTLPDFRLWDRVAAERATPRDLVTHRTGLPRHDAVWFNSSMSRQEIYDNLRHLEPGKDFRTTYQYNNLMFMTAGYLAGKVAGTTWEELARRRVLEPAGMKDANFSVHDSQRAADFSRTYAEVKGKIEETPLRVLDSIAPAGSINANLEDMTRYLLLHLNDGKVEDKAVIPAAVFAEMRKPQTIMPPSALPEYEGFGANSYGLALMLTTYRGHELVYHTGTIGGYHALLSYLPKDRIGVVTLQNRVARPAPQILSLRIYDQLLGLEPIERTKGFQAAERKQEAEEEKAKKAAQARRKAGTKPSHPPAEYAGNYAHPAYGVIEVKAENGKLRLRRNLDGGVLNHFHYDVFEVAEEPMNPVSGLKVRFLTDVDGEVDQLAVKLEPAVKEIVFTRRISR